ncbi:hypothetical protein EAVG_00970, partial [Escherichia coli H420]
NGGTSERLLAESTEFLRIMRNGDENADDIAGRFTGTYTGADARSCKYGTTCEITDKKGKGLPESGKGEALEIPHSPEKEPVSCLTDWHYSPSGSLFSFITPNIQAFHNRSSIEYLLLKSSTLRCVAPM